MSLSLRGHTTGLSGVPQHWRGPLPDVSIRRDLRPLDGYAQVPMDLLFGGHADLAVLVWTWLRLRSEDRAEVASYQQFADALGFGDLTPKAVQKRFSAALSSVLDQNAPLGPWLERERTLDNQQLYRAVVPRRAAKRYAMLRRSDLARLLVPAPGKKTEPVAVADLADFARWQLECGQRGWTADPLSVIAARWKVGEATLWRSRARLEAVRLLEVTTRPGGRYPDLVWLRELYDPHWQVPSIPTENPQPTQAQGHGQGAEVSFTSGGSSLSDPGGPSFQNRGGESFNNGGSYKRNLTGGSLTEDLAGLGGASATPLSSVTRKAGNAEPQAAPRSTTGSEVDAARRQLLASRLLAGQPFLAAADRRWRSGMLATIGRAIGRGLDPEHLARALQRVVEAGEVELHCEVVRTAVRQAWADQRAGMCSECGADPERHLAGCPGRAAEVEAAGEDEAEIRRLIIASLAEAQGPAGRARSAGHAADVSPPAASPRADPLRPYLDVPVAVEPDAAPEVVAEWLAARIASRLVEVDVDDVPGRRRALDRSAAWWAGQMPVEQHQAIDLATAQLHFALSTPTRQAS